MAVGGMGVSAGWVGWVSMQEAVGPLAAQVQLQQRWQAARSIPRLLHRRLLQGCRLGVCLQAQPQHQLLAALQQQQQQAVALQCLVSRYALRCVQACSGTSSSSTGCRCRRCSCFSMR
jgi:hypothetical protein